MSKKTREARAKLIPVSVGDELEVTSLRLGYRGEGVARHQGFTVFVEGLLPHERALVRIREVHASFANAKLLSILESSPEREVPQCPAFGSCGGCQVQHLNYESQLLWKRQLVVDALVRIGKFDHSFIENTVQPTIGMKSPWRYRNKVSLLASPKGDQFVAGFVEEGTHEPVIQNECLIRPELHDELLAGIVRILQQFDVKAYSAISGSGTVRQIRLRNTGAGDVMVVLATVSALHQGQDIAKAIASLQISEGRVVSVVEEIIPIDRNSRVESNAVEHVLWGQQELKVTVMGLEFFVSAASFLQVNPEQTEVLYQIALNMAELHGTQIALDLYSGIGTLSLAAARHAKHVIGVEVVPEAVKDALRNKELNKQDNASFYCGRAEQVVPELVKEGTLADVVLLDPPRAGCKPEVIQAMIDSGAKRIVYISCNPATLARDLSRLAESGFQLERVVPVDMFPQTAHVETVVLLEKN